MTINLRFSVRRAAFVAILFAVGCFLVSKPTAAQSSGTYVDECSSGGDFPVETTGCIYGDVTGLSAYQESDLESEGYSDWVIGQVSEAQIWDGSTLVADSGNPNCESEPTGEDCSGDGGESSYASTSTGPVNSGATYSLSGSTWEWYDPSNEDDPSDAYWTSAGEEAISVQPIQPTTYQGFINPKYMVVGVTYAPPGASSYVQYTGTTSIGNTVAIGSTFSNKVGFSISVNAGIQGWGASGSVTGTSSTDYTQGSSTNTSTTFTKATSLSYKTGGTGNAFSPVDSDYDVIWLWLNPVVVLTYAPSTSNTPAQIQWNGYGYDTNDPSGTAQPDVYPVLAGWLNGDFGDDPSVDAVLARSWASGSNYVWPSGQGPGLTTADKSTILTADPFSGCTYDNTALVWTSCQYASNNFGSLPPSTTPDGRFTLVTLPNNPNPIPYEQAGPGNGAGITSAYSVNQTNTQSVAQGTSTMFTQEFSMEEVFSAAPFGIGVKTTLNQSDTLSWTSSWLNTLTTTTTLQQALSITGPGCPADPGPCSPLYGGPGQFDVYQDNQYGTFMFYPTN